MSDQQHQRVVEHQVPQFGGFGLSTPQAMKPGAVKQTGDVSAARGARRGLRDISNTPLVPPGAGGGGIKNTSKASVLVVQPAGDQGAFKNNSKFGTPGPSYAAAKKTFTAALSQNQEPRRAIGTPGPSYNVANRQIMNQGANTTSISNLVLQTPPKSNKRSFQQAFSAEGRQGLDHGTKPRI